jgi:hypothetical protein
MAITIYSPYNSQPVEVREQDVGRAVKDGEGRTFYVLAKSDGTGYYGAMTRMGGQKDEDRAADIEYRSKHLQNAVDDELDSVAAPARRGSNRGTIVVLVFLGIVGGIIWAAKTHLGKDTWPWQKGPQANAIILEQGKPGPAGPAAAPKAGAPAAAAAAGGAGASANKYDPYAPLPPLPDGNVALTHGAPIDSAPVSPGSAVLTNHGAPVKGPVTPDGAPTTEHGKPLKSAPTSAPSTSAIKPTAPSKN